MMSETAEITTVVDAFDKDDPFDLNITIGFSQMWKNAKIRRETELFQPGLSTGNFVPTTENVASYSQSVSTLNMGVDIGIFRDLGLSFRLPLILADSRELGDLDGSTRNPQRLLDANGQPLFSVPFKSPTRSGVDWFQVGLDYAILNQQRDWTKPTWVFGVDGRFAVGSRLHACNDAAPNGIKCPDPYDPNRGDPTKAVADRQDPGISRGMNGIGVHTIFSRRFGYIEPYTGFNFRAEFPQSNSDFGQTNDLKGSLVNHPPLTGTITMGLEVVPYEHREQFQRLVADFRVNGTYVSPGREYSELFDALGTSNSQLLTVPNPGAYRTGPNGSGSVGDFSVPRVPFTGITDVHEYGSFGASTSVTYQVGEYVKFQAGFGLQYNQSHLITAADACNPDFKDSQGAAGPCHTTIANGQSITGIPNPNHRDAIDLPGHRFSVDDATIVHLWLNGVVMF
jgi:hypothetical protein